MTARPTTTVAPATVTIRGSISDPGGYPLAGVAILLFEDSTAQGRLLDTAITDDVGGYRFTGVRAAAGEELSVAASDASGAHVFTQAILTIGPDGATTHHMTMPVAGCIQGEVSARNGTGPAQPGGGVCVTAIGATIVQAVGVSATGRFRVGGLPPGEYVVVFEDGDPGFAGSDHSAKASVTPGRTTTIEDQVLSRRWTPDDGNLSGA